MLQNLRQAFFSLFRWRPTKDDTASVMPMLTEIRQSPLTALEQVELAVEVAKLDLDHARKHSTAYHIRAAEWRLEMALHAFNAARKDAGLTFPLGGGKKHV